MYRWGNGVILASMYVALLMKANASDDELGRLSVLAGMLITANMVMIAAILIQSLLLVQELRNSMSIAEDIIPSVQRHRSVAPNPVHAVTVEGDWHE